VLPHLKFGRDGRKGGNGNNSEGTDSAGCWRRDGWLSLGSKNPWRDKGLINIDGLYKQKPISYLEESGWARRP